MAGKVHARSPKVGPNTTQMGKTHVEASRLRKSGAKSALPVRSITYLETSKGRLTSSTHNFESTVGL